MHLEEVNAGVRAREGVKVQLLCSPPKASSFSPVEEEVPCCYGPSKNRAHTDQTKAAECRMGLSLPCLSRYLRVHWGGRAGSVLSCLPWGHLPLMVILIYAQAFNRILIGCVAALSDSVTARTWFWWVFVFAFLFFCIFLHAHFCSLMVKIISLAYLHISPVRKKSEASHGRPLITNYKVTKTWKCSIGGQQESKCGRLEHSSVSSLHKFKRGASLYFCNSVCSLALC